jgi:hypothetical protein
MFEHHKKPLLPRRQFAVRVLRNLTVAFGLVGVCLLIGMAGYHGFEKLSWVDAFVNASMILSGMGPLNPLLTDGGKIFAGCYALFSGLALVAIIATIAAPIFHRFLHKFHVESGN